MRYPSLVAFFLAFSSASATAQYCAQEIALHPAQLASSGFGDSVALSAEYAAVGDPFPDGAAMPGTGVVNVYARHPVGGHLLFDAALVSSDGAVDDRFGVSCDVDGSTLVVGAEGHDAQGMGAGAAYVFERQAGQWVEVQKLLPVSLQPSDAFGGRVAIEGDWMAVSASGRNEVFVYRRSAAGWAPFDTIRPANSMAAGAMGVAISGDTLAISDSNVCGVFEFSQGTQAWSQILPVATASAFSFTGLALTPEGLTLARDYGLVEVYERSSSGGWMPPRSIFTTEPGAVGRMGNRVLVMRPEEPFVQTWVKSGSSWSLDQSAPGGRTSSVAIDTDGVSALVAGVGTPSLYDFDCGAVGTISCSQSVVNSTGSTGRIQALGSDVVAVNSMELVATVLPENSFGYFLASQLSDESQVPGVANGKLCLGGAIGRFVGPGEIQNTGVAGGFRLSIDLGGLPTPTGPAGAAAGESWFFQAWFRDVTPAAPSDFTDAVRVIMR